LRKKITDRGFTIVELLIVIVIIGVLAAITLVVYNSINQRAIGATLQSDLSDDYKQLLISYYSTGAYPADTSNVKKSSGTTLQYTVDNTGQPSYCLTATNTGLSNGFYVSNLNSQPITGLCSGHVLNPAPVQTAPVVTVQPSTATSFRFYDDYPMENINLTSAATGTPTPTVVWQKRMDSGAWVTISDATSTTLQEPVSSARGWTASWFNGSSWLGLWTLRAAWTNSVGTVYSNASGAITIYSVP
jgi:prepilin-type N-terminal cleavage/methylation domain-containing protein